MDREYLIKGTEAAVGHPVTGIELRKLAGDASTRNFYRLYYSPLPHGERVRVKGISSDNGQSVVLMELGQPNPQDQADLVAVWKYFDRWQLEVPKLYHEDPERGWLWFEDLGDVTLQDFISLSPGERGQGEGGCFGVSHAEDMKGNDSPNGFGLGTGRNINSDKKIYTAYQQAIDLVLKIQQAGAKEPDPHCPAFDRAFDIEKLSWELNFFLKYMLEENLNLTLPQYCSSPINRGTTGWREGDKALLQNFFLELSRRLAAEPRYLAHRDYHSRNLMVQDGRLRLVDYQDARLGLCQYDLASLLRDSYVSLDEAMRDDLLEYYICRKEEWENKPIDHRHFREIFDYTCIQRNLKAVGTFAYQNCIRKNPGYLQYIPRTLGYVAQNMGKYPALRPVQQVLGEYLPQIL